MTGTPAANHGGGDLPEYVGRYRVLERIGRGAMGVVYAALDEQLDRRVAVKLMLADFEEEPDLRERFYREARITGQLAHRNIVTVYDLGEEHGRPFIVMELLDGVPLADYMHKPEAHDLDTKIDLMMQVCDGLQNAHRSGVIHRDIKPSNLYVQRDGTLKILDFGIARISASNLTGSGFLVGTPEYMSPEQTQGRTVDARSDVYSAASVFYFILCNRSPFGQRDLLKLLDAIVNEAPKALTDENAPEAVRRVVMKALAKAPADRYQNCTALLEDLDRTRRNLNAATYRTLQVSLDRYREILVMIEERRALGHSLRVPRIDAICDDDAARLETKFPAFARQAKSNTIIEPMDRAAANAALEALQIRHNAERATLQALRQQSADVLRGQTTARLAAARQEPFDTGITAQGRPAGDSLKARAAAFWRGLRESRH